MFASKAAFPLDRIAAGRRASEEAFDPVNHGAAEDDLKEHPRRPDHDRDDHEREVLEQHPERQQYHPRRRQRVEPRERRSEKRPERTRDHQYTEDEVRRAMVEEEAEPRTREALE